MTDVLVDAELGDRTDPAGTIHQRLPCSMTADIPSTSTHSQLLASFDTRWAFSNPGTGLDAVPVCVSEAVPAAGPQASKPERDAEQG